MYKRQGTPDTIKGNVAEDDLVIISDREESQLICIEANCSCIIVTSGFDISKEDVYKRQRSLSRPDAYVPSHHSQDIHRRL